MKKKESGHKWVNSNFFFFFDIKEKVRKLKGDNLTDFVLSVELTYQVHFKYCKHIFEINLQYKIRPMNVNA